MFLLRSAFWLILAFVVIRPAVDLDTNALSAQAMQAGQRVVADQFLGADCGSLQCLGGQALLSAALAAGPTSTPVAAPMQAAPALDPAPIPRPRPANRAG